MKLTIEKTLGIESAEIELVLGQIVEVVGPNASGKTSLAVCAQAVLAREANPLGLSVADAKRSYPHDGADDARVLLATGGPAYGDSWNDVQWLPHRGTLTANGGLDNIAHPEAVGLVDFTAKRGEKERRALFQATLLPAPEKVLEAVRERLSAYLPEKDVVGIMEMLSDKEWDAVAKTYANRSTDAKRDWRGVTGAPAWGIKVGADWRPAQWLVDYDLMTVQEAEAKVTDARDALNAMHRVQAVSEADQQRAEDAAGRIPWIETAVKDFREQKAILQGQLPAIPLAAALEDAQGFERLIAELEFEQNAGQACPACGAGLTVLDGKIVEVKSPEDIQIRITELREQFIAAMTRAAQLEEECEPVRRSLAKVSNDQAAAQADLHLAKTEASKTGEVQSEADRVALAQAEQAVEDAREVVRLVKAEADASRLHETIVRYTEIARALGPEGVRARMMADGLKKLNAGLRAIASESGWPLTAVADNGGITVGDRAVAMCSESERWRAQAAIQLTLGALTGSQVVVLDRADLLDFANKGGLVKALERVASRTKMAVLVCTTGTVIDRVCPDWPQVAIADGKVVS